jgi:hypothetical protein
MPDDLRLRFLGGMDFGTVQLRGVGRLGVATFLRPKHHKLDLTG